MTLSEKRCLFTRLLSSLILWAHDQGFELNFGEGYVAQTDARDGDYDGPHRSGGAHYTGLGMDLNLFVDGKWVSDGSHVVWTVIGVRWEGMNDLCRWGGRFNDANHFSLWHEGRS